MFFFGRDLDRLFWLLLIVLWFRGWVSNLICLDFPEIIFFDDSDVYDGYFIGDKQRDWSSSKYKRVQMIQSNQRWQYVKRTEN